MIKYLPKMVLVSLVCGFLYTLIVQIPMIGLTFIGPMYKIAPHLFINSYKHVFHTFIGVALTSPEAYFIFGLFGAGVTFAACLIVLLVMRLRGKQN